MAVDVAVIDTGIAKHADLNVVGGKNCSTGRSYDDGNGHGTHVAGTIGAKDDGNGAVGVAPGARLWAVRVLNNAGSGTASSVICGIDWVTANESTIEVADMSLGGSASDTTSTPRGGGRLQHDQRDVHGVTARGRSGSPLQGPQPRRVTGSVRTALVDAGSTDGNDGDDRDRTKEPFRNVATF